MVLQGEAVGYVALNAFGAMTKVALVAGVGFYFALYPKSDPYLSSSALKYVSRISNSICLPALIVSSVGSGLSVGLLSRVGILILFCFFNGFISAVLASTVGKFIDKESSIHVALFVAISCPNVVSLPLMVFQSLCSQPIATADYDGNSATCFTDSSTMIFVYSIGWHLMYWSYFFPLLQGLSDIPADSNDPATAAGGSGGVVGESKNSSTKGDHPPSTRVISGDDPKARFERPSMVRSRSSYYWSASQSMFASFRNQNFGFQQARSFRNAFSDFETHIVADKLKTFRGWCQTVLLSPVMVAIFIGIFIGLIEPLQRLLFVDSDSVLSPLGAALVTLGQPTVCLNSLIMAASLAKVDLEWDNAWTRVKSEVDQATTRMEDWLFNTHKYTTVAESSKPVVDTDAPQKAPQDSGDSDAPKSDSHSIELQSTTVSPLHAPVIAESHSDVARDGSPEGDTESKADEVAVTIPSIKPEPVTKPITSSNPAVSTEPALPDKVKRPHWRSIASLFVCRMVLPGVFALLLLQLFLASGIISPSDKMLQLVIILVCCSPPAQLVIVSLNQLELSRTAGALAYLYLFTYVASILVMTIWATIAMSIIY